MCYATVSLIPLLKDLPDFKPIIDKYRQKFIEDTEILLNGVHDRTYYHVYVSRIMETSFLLNRYELITDEMVCEFLTRLITPPKRGKHIGSSRLNSVATTLRKMPVMFPEKNRKEWIPMFIEKLKKFYDMEKNRKENPDDTEMFDEDVFPIFYENILKVLKRQLEIEGDEPSKEERVEINTMRCNTLLRCYEKIAEKHETSMKETKLEIEKTREKVKKAEEKMVEVMNQLIAIDEASTSNKKKRLEINLKIFINNRGIIVKELNKLLTRKKAIEIKKKKFLILVQNAEADLEEVDTPWLGFIFTEDDDGPSTSSGL